MAQKATGPSPSLRTSRDARLSEDLSDADLTTIDKSLNIQHKLIILLCFTNEQYRTLSE